MSSKQPSDQSSISSASSSRPPPRSLIVFKVSTDKDEKFLYDDLSYNYGDVKRVSRKFDQDGKILSSIRVDFNSANVVSDILNDNEIYISNKRYDIRPSWSRICYRCEEEGHVAADCPRIPIPAWRLAELLEQQKTNFDTLIENFESRWNERLSKFKIPSTNTNVKQLMPVINDLSTISNQLNQQNTEMQKQINAITARIQSIHTK